MEKYSRAEKIGKKGLVVFCGFIFLMVLSASQVIANDYGTVIYTFGEVKLQKKRSNESQFEL